MLRYVVAGHHPRSKAHSAEPKLQSEKRDFTPSPQAVCYNLDSVFRLSSVVSPGLVEWDGRQEVVAAERT